MIANPNSLTKKFFYKERDNNGQVFSLQRYSLHDGEGIRTTIFLKGCGLSCQWCSNPESQNRHIDIAFNEKKCIGLLGCDLCLSKCDQQAIVLDAENGVRIDRDKCNSCNACTSSCPTEALYSFGEKMSTAQIIDFIARDDIFYNRSKGGVTVSGGEPLLQGKFTLSIINAVKERHISTAIETCGDGAWRWLAQIAEQVDEIFFDIKSMNSAKHKSFTGKGNEIILSNFRKLVEQFPEKCIHVRTPLIPAFNDSLDDFIKIIDFIGSYPNVDFEILPYHRLGSFKYRLLGRDYMPGSIWLKKTNSQKIIEYAKNRLTTRYRQT
ncbi:TPA: glycyl-radical enzyme activating protein [Serratia marcescens]